MALNDPLGDMITRIRNAQERSKSKVSTPGSKLRASVLEVLKNEGYIRGYSSLEKDGRSEVDIELKYFDGAPRVNNGLGVAIVSTPKGVMADHDARDANVGGEILCTVF